MSAQGVHVYWAPTMAHAVCNHSPLRDTNLHGIKRCYEWKTRVALL